MLKSSTTRGWLAGAVASVILLVALSVVAVARYHVASPTDRVRDDAMYVNGQKRPRTEIAAFMKREVMPVAREMLGPLVGGPDEVTCLTCHGEGAVARQWQMPAVRALPEPDLRLARMERYASLVGSQMRNAVYGYLAENDNQRHTTYMRGVVMPRMARLLRRPPYDFTKTYAYNQARAAFGCYHCHRIS